MQSVGPKSRTIALIIYGVVLAAVHYFLVEQSFQPTGRVLWLYNGFASLLFGSRLLNPYFTPPADAATNGFLAVLSMVAASISFAPGSNELFLVYIVGAFGTLVLVVSLTAILSRPGGRLKPVPWVFGLDQIARSLGSPRVIYGVVILTAVWLFHSKHPNEVIAILTTWAVILTLEPVEGAIRLALSIRQLIVDKLPNRIVGLVAAYQSPGMVLIRQTSTAIIKRGTTLLVTDNQGPDMLAVAINYVGRDEGNLLRALTFPAPSTQLRRLANFRGTIGSGVALQIELSEDDLNNIGANEPTAVFQRINQFCGIVDEGSRIEYLEFEVIDDKDLTEGRLVETEIAGQMVLFQVMEGLTREEIVQQKNKYGYARAKARKIGRWNQNTKKFEPVKWLPSINAPVFLKETEEHETSHEAVGKFPETSFTVGIDTTNAVTHNTAILGILGIGKSFLAIELVERMIGEGIKVICLDLTNQYAEQLSSFLDPSHEREAMDQLAAACGRGEVSRNVEEGGMRLGFKSKVTEQLREFLKDEGERYLRVYNPSQFEVWQQTGGAFNNDAAMASLTACEITAIISEAALEIAQEKGMTNEARVCLVYEEAHSLVPEFNSVAAKGDQTATAATARAILQGRKYGLGCLLITQRTANVTKTILNQCNTIFAMRTFDDTGKDFLSNYIGRDYANLLPSLEARQAVVFGKASTCENPVLVQLNDQEDFRTAFRAVTPPRALPDNITGDGPEPMAADQASSFVANTDFNPFVANTDFNPLDDDGDDSPF